MSLTELLGWSLILGPALLLLYAYLGYPLLLRVWAARAARPQLPLPSEPAEWPYVSISVPAYNERAQIRGLIENLLALDYPADRLQLQIVSDASSDGTDEIVEEYADRGVELLRMPKRGGKTAAENEASRHLRGQIVVNTDASIRLHPEGLKPLIAAFRDPTVGAASGRDVSMARLESDANVGEAGYVGYEMAVRALETRVAGIVGASGSFYATREELHRVTLPNHLSRDFAAALVAREHGFRTVSVDEAVCYVPRTESLRREYRRKVRTMSRGMETLMHKAHLLNPFRYGSFAFMLWSHKVARWLGQASLWLMWVGFWVLAPSAGWAAGFALLGFVGLLIAVVGWFWPPDRTIPRVVAVITGVAMVTVAVTHALSKALHGDEDPTWEPTRRELVIRSGDG